MSFVGEAPAIDEDFEFFQRLAGSDSNGCWIEFLEKGLTSFGLAFDSIDKEGGWAGR